MSIFLFLILIFITYSFNNTNELNHELKKNKTNKRKLSSSPLNIYIETSIFNNSYSRTEISKSIIFKALDKAKKTLELLIEVNEEPTNINIYNLFGPNNQLNGFSKFELMGLGSPLLNEGVTAHLAILVRGIDANIDPTNKCIDKIGIIDNNGNGRPTVGYIVYDTIINNDDNFIENNDIYKEEYLSTLFLHQFTHLLGFTRSVVTLNGSRMNITNKTFVRTGNPIIKEIIHSANLLKEAQRYFNCTTSDLEGLELEDENQNCDNEFIHWDKRILLGDYMTTDIYVQDQVISKFTLLLLEETGFYNVKYYTGGLMKFGKNTGCKFFTEDCNALASVQTANTQRYSKFKNEFCVSETKTTCSSSRMSRGLCENPIDGGDLLSEGDKYYRTSWIPDPSIGGLGKYGNKYADYCPISVNEKERSNNNKVKSYIGNCKLGTRKDYGLLNFALWENKYNSSIYNYSFFTETYGEKFSDISFCAFSSVIHSQDPKKNIYKGFIRPTCYEMHCSDEFLTIQINDQYIVCPKEGGFVNIGGDYEGHLLCPDYNLICDQTRRCNNLFDCVTLCSEEKGLSYNYIKNNVSMEILLPIPEYTYDKFYELAENGKCPKYCSECKEYKKCFECNNDYPYYIGTKMNDNNPIICSAEKPSSDYYNITIGKNTVFFKCFENCLYCIEEKKCNGCYPKYYLGAKNETCEDSISGCKVYNIDSLENDPKNGNYPRYKECSQCDNDNNFYCIDNNKAYCQKIDDINAYYNNNNDCKSKCSDLINNCYRCDGTKCNQCIDGWHTNHDGSECLINIANCLEHNSYISECDKCKTGYYCLYGDKTKCVEVSDISLYYIASKEVCYEKCSDQFERCIKCDKGICEKCENSYYVYNGNECIEGIEHCLEHFYNITNKYCEKCEENYYCLDNIKEVCSFVDPTNISLYYYIDDNDENSCIEKCSKKFSFCLKCNKSYCETCANYTIIDTKTKKCVIDPSQVIIDDCLIKMHQIDDDINKININDIIFNYYPNFPSISTIDHYINENYTITVFLNSDCTEDLLNKGYYKIDSKELQKEIATEFGVNEKVIFSIFITYNSKSHLRFYDNKMEYLDVSVHNKTDIYTHYTITRKFIKNINDTLGPIVTTLIENEKLNIFERDSDFFNDYCHNITLLGIDIPLSKRLHFLYLHNYSTQIACLGLDCEIDKYNFEDYLTTCKCKIGNTLNDIIEPNEFKHYENSGEKKNNFMDSIGIIKCFGNGFNSKNMKANAGIFLSLIGIGFQIILFIYYLIFSKAVILPKKVTNPPKKQLAIITDWDKSLKKRNETENEVYIQPRDDDDEQLLEEEKSYDNDIMDLMNVSIDTNVEGANLKTGKNILSEKPEKRILILLNVKGEKNLKNLKDYEDLSSDAEISKLNEDNQFEKLTFCQIYWFVVSIKQHIINFFSSIKCCKITKSFIPLPLRIIRSIFLVFLSMVFNILFLNQNYYEKKFIYFNDKFTIIHSEDTNLEISLGEKISYAISNTFIYALISMILLLIVNFIIGYIFFSIRNKICEASRNNDISEIKKIISKTKKMNIIFFIIIIILMIVFFMTITAFVGAYGGGFVDYFISGIISLIFLEIIPFLWSLILSFLIYLGSKKKIKSCSNVSNFFIF